MKKEWIAVLALTFTTALGARGEVFGRVIPIGGHAADLALDESRGVVYVANFTANRIEIINLRNLVRQSSMNLAAQPAALALSPNGRYLLVTHYANYQPPAGSFTGMTLIDLVGGVRQTYTLSSPVVGAAFTSDNRALVVTSTEFHIFDPATGELALLDTVANMTLRYLPVPPATYPSQITGVSLASSGDGERVYGLTDTFQFRFDRHPRRLEIIYYFAQPKQAPRVVSVNRDGSYYAAGWAVFDWRGTLVAQFPNPSGELEKGSHAIDSQRGLIYAQVPEKESTDPVLLVCETYNLTVLERFRLPENLAGKAQLSSDGSTMYAISASGLAVLPVGEWRRQRRLTVSEEQVFFETNYCDQRALVKEIFLVDGAGGVLDFKITGASEGLSVWPTSGTTPAGVQLRVDPAAFGQRQGTVVFDLEITSRQAVNLPQRLRVAVNLRQPDQRGTVIPVAGKLVDILADPVRRRFFVLRQDNNRVLVFDGGDYRLLATLRTAAVPTQMAITADRRYLIVGHDGAQMASVFDLETLEEVEPIRFPGGHYPRSIAATGRAILAASRGADLTNTIDRVDMFTRTAAQLGSLGIYENTIHEDTVLAAGPDGSAIAAFEADGNLMLYDAAAGTFTVSRRDSAKLSGAYAAGQGGWFVADNQLLNSSLGAAATLDESGRRTQGAAFFDQAVFLLSANAEGGPAVIQRFQPGSTLAYPAVRLADSAAAGWESSAFRRMLAVLVDGSALVALTSAGFTVVASGYDAAIAPPAIEQVVNAADFSRPVAPGSLITVLGSRLSPVNAASSEMPLPRALGQSCLLANGTPIPLVFVSSSQINAQLPYTAAGSVGLTLYTPGGISDTFYINVASTAPAVFRSGTAGPLTGLATVVRAANNQLATPANPVRRGDVLVIYLTGLGATAPAVTEGEAAPASPLAVAVEQPLVTLGGKNLPVEYAGLTPRLAGVYQINVRVTDDVPAGLNVPLRIEQSSGSTAVELRVVH